MNQLHNSLRERERECSPHCSRSHFTWPFWYNVIYTEIYFVMLSTRSINRKRCMHVTLLPSPFQSLIYTFSYLADISCEHEWSAHPFSQTNPTNQPIERSIDRPTNAHALIYIFYQDYISVFFHSSFKLFAFDFRFSCFI